MEVQLIHEQTYKSQYDLESAVEKFYDSLREEFGMVEDEDIKQFDHISRVFEATAVMENGLKLKVEIFFADDADEDESWVCKAYQVA
ncbi:hypothetical protein CON48_18550 [Bacillus thuringiensis]|uniref:Uncharacterized protein n=5 Tax=Bacillus cereus group TaxID=86661 RepID=A0A9X6Z1Y2_BACTU|nr:MULTISPECIES: hypothetical protein [Bacillus]ACK97298.1 hypothetical protein BCG9842_B2649 [Bacillus cereus G9842]AFQ14789.1 hypothetical protein BTG_06515 [Bacillus thuringiensis HD-771]AJQ59346.1 hypothetical protein SD98_13935 [Bacillus thuringiensis serovar morrisoni]AMR85077.1 hypothetical protein A3L20_13970 [Bacillus thuringiensis]AND08104.1 hypothetical protein Bt4C1_13160 [Bacillus thuringiensis serovar alesti]